MDFRNQRNLIRLNESLMSGSYLNDIYNKLLNEIYAPPEDPLKGQENQKPTEKPQRGPEFTPIDKDVDLFNLNLDFLVNGVYDGWKVKDINTPPFTLTPPLMWHRIGQRWFIRSGNNLYGRIIFNTIQGDWPSELPIMPIPGTNPPRYPQSIPPERWHEIPGFMDEFFPSNPSDWGNRPGYGYGRFHPYRPNGLGNLADHLNEIFQKYFGTLADPHNPTQAIVPFRRILDNFPDDPNRDVREFFDCSRYPELWDLIVDQYLYLGNTEIGDMMRKTPTPGLYEIIIPRARNPTQDYGPTNPVRRKKPRPDINP